MSQCRSFERMTIGAPGAEVKGNSSIALKQNFAIQVCLVIEEEKGAGTTPTAHTLHGVKYIPEASNVCCLFVSNFISG
jgi:hypothetical protein